MFNLLITQRVYTDSFGETWDALESATTRYFNSLGINLLPVSNFAADIEGYLKGVNCSGLILSGGGDVNPVYCSSGDSSGFMFSQEREAVESFLVNKMVFMRLPILGICHGMQFLNCYFGGSITAGIHNNILARRPRQGHKIKILKKIFGLEDSYNVNQYHNNGMTISQTAACFDVFAIDEEFGVVEGIIHKELPICAIQWHPERPSPDTDFNERLIRGLLKI